MKEVKSFLRFMFEAIGVIALLLVLTRIFIPPAFTKGVTPANKFFETIVK